MSLMNSDDLAAEAKAAGQAAEIVVGLAQLRPGDEIVGRQLHGAHDRVYASNDWTVEVGAGEHPVAGGECIQLRRRPNDPSSYELNLWNGQEYFDGTLFHIRRPQSPR